MMKVALADASRPLPTFLAAGEPAPPDLPNRAARPGDPALRASPRRLPRHRRDPLAARRRPLRPAVRGAPRRNDPAVADQPGRHRRQRHRSGPLRRPARTQIGSGGQLQPRYRHHQLLRIDRPMAAAGRQPGPAQLDDPARRHRRRRSGAGRPPAGSRWSWSARAAKRRCAPPASPGRENAETAAGSVPALKFVVDGHSAYDASFEIWLDPARGYLPARAISRSSRATPNSSFSCSAPIPSDRPTAAAAAACNRVRRPQLAVRRSRHAHALQLGQLRRRRLRHSARTRGRRRARARAAGRFRDRRQVREEGHLPRRRRRRDASRPAPWR